MIKYADTEDDQAQALLTWSVINLPASKAAELYNLVKVGDVVVTHQ